MVDGGWIVRDVQARPESDLEHVAVERSGDASTDRRELAAAHDQVNEARNDPISIEPHQVSIAERGARDRRRGSIISLESVRVADAFPPTLLVTGWTHDPVLRRAEADDSWGRVGLSRSGVCEGADLVSLMLQQAREDLYRELCATSDHARAEVMRSRQESCSPAM